MKELYVVSYDDSGGKDVHLQLQRQIQKLNDYLLQRNIEKILSHSVLFALQFVDPVVKRFRIPVLINAHFCTNSVPLLHSIAASFEEELLASHSPVVFVMTKQATMALFQYIDPFFLKKEWTDTGALELFHIVCEADHIGVERVWQPFSPVPTDLGKR
ncbi:MAG: hypothetical protein ACE3JP_00260 [Ectobacillus sp.]